MVVAAEKKRPGRPALKQNEIIEAVRSRILRGELVPSGRLPTRRELGSSFSASLITVQQALDQLSADGFIESHGRGGTFVVANPPHTSHYALVFPGDPSQQAWTPYCNALCNEGRRIRRDGVHSVSFYYFDYGLAFDFNESARELIRDMQSYRVAGIIFASAIMKSLAHTPILDLPGIPRVEVSQLSYSVDIPRVTMDFRSLIDRALDELAAAGRRRIATMRAFEMPEDFEKYLAEGLARRGMVSPAYWQLGTFTATAKWARNITHLLMRPGQADRPDGLFVIDDNLVPHVTVGLIEAGVRVGEDVDVVAHCNFPYPTSSVVPVRRLGYDARSVLTACLELVDTQRQGRRAPAVTRIPAVFEEEVEQI
jgi:hypothetical protein